MSSIEELDHIVNPDYQAFSSAIFPGGLPGEYDPIWEAYWPLAPGVDGQVVPVVEVTLVKDQSIEFRTQEEIEHMLATNGLRATALIRGGKRPKEALPPKHIRDASREPKLQPPTKEVEVRDEKTGKVVRLETVPMRLDERAKPPSYAKHVGATITPEVRESAIDVLQRDSETHKDNRQRVR
ncbi:hypothetical protein HYW35_03670 [Candidatus Saccharibacteria bacterium]|nr:hypothetical protein [Candidatus Saccharibacteria bacterium]